MRRTPIVLLALCGLLLVACGDDDDDTAGGGGGGDFCTNMTEIDKLMESGRKDDVTEAVELMQDTTPPDEIVDEWQTVTDATEALLSDDASQEDIASAQTDLQEAGEPVFNYFDKNC